MPEPFSPLLTPPAGQALSSLSPSAETATDLTADRLPPPPARLEVPGYEVLGVLGRGGMGVVYKARQIDLDRLVALKVIRPTGPADAEERARFRTEALAMARLAHPNIVQVYEVGEHDGRPFLALEFVDGGSLAGRLGGRPLPPATAARLAWTLAQAVQHAHEHGVIHRDLKPANVLLASPRFAGTEDRGSRIEDRETLIVDPRSSAVGPALEEMVPKITDFGLAKRLDIDLGQTRSGAILGTPGYMSPEQASGKVHAVGPGADVYALGAVLYEMLTGRPPFQGASLPETLVQVLAADPAPPRCLQPGVPPDLETICLKCLHKEPQRRYASARDLADDLRRFLDGSPIHARPVGIWERAWRWCRRNPLSAVLGAVLALLLLTAAVVASIAALSFRQMAQRQEGLARQADEARQRQEQLRAEAESANDRLRGRLYFQDLALADLELTAAAPARAERLLDACPPHLRRWEWHLLKRRCRQPPVTLASPGEWVESIAFSPDGRRLIAGGGGERSGSVILWDLAGRQIVRRFPGHAAFVHEVAFSPDGRLVASAGADEAVIVWQADTGERLQTYRGHGGWVGSVAFSPDGGLIASAGEDQVVRLWSPLTGEERRTLRGHSWVVRRVRFSPDGRRLASASWDGTVALWDVSTGERLRQLAGHQSQVAGIAFSPDGRLLASAGGIGSRREVRLWEAASGEAVWARRGHSDYTEVVVFSPDGRCLASVSGHSSGPGLVNLWEVEGGQQILSLCGHAKPVRCAAFSPDGRWLATGGADGAVLLWDLSPEEVTSDR
jgi:serine/threonine protein kinase